MCVFQDDLRKDFRYMEFCTIVNNLLRNNQEARKRNLHVRTFVSIQSWQSYFRFTKIGLKTQALLQNQTNQFVKFQNQGSFWPEDSSADESRSAG